MKKRILALLLCFTLLLGLLPAALTAAADGDVFKVVDASGTAASYVEVPQNDKIVLSTQKADSVAAGAYQWQISVPNSNDVWANIVGAQGSSLELSYAMVANMLSDGVAYVRCRLTTGGETLHTAAVTVAVTYAATPQPAQMISDIKPVVISEAQPIGDPIITLISTPASAPVSAPVQSAPAAPSTDAAPAADPNTEGDTPSDTPATNEGDAVNETPAANETPATNDAPADNGGDSGNVTPSDNGSTDNSGAVAANDTPTTYTIIINYQFKDGKQAAQPWSANVATGSTYTQDVVSPVVVGYKPDYEVVQVNASEAKTYTVTYQPAEVEFTVKHYQQNASNDEYTLVDTEPKKGLTESAVGENLAKSYEGFTALLYDTTTKIAADGSTVVEIKYDRMYYLMNFDLDGGYGVEPIYARYGAPINIGTPTKPGYSFGGWNKEIPKTMPAENTTYKANWETGESGFTVVFWYENANDDGYSVAGTHKPGDVKPGTKVSSDDYKTQNFDGRDDDHFTYNAEKAEKEIIVAGDGSTVLNVYYRRSTYTLTFKDAQRTLTCTKTEHEHSHAQCCTKRDGHWFGCNSDKCPVGYEHTHTDNCYKTSDLKITAKYDSDITSVWKNDPIKSLLDQGYVFESSVTNKYYSFLEKMPGQDVTMTPTYWYGSTYEWYYYLEVPSGMSAPAGAVTKTDGGKTYYLYHTTTVKGDDISLTYDEDYYPITGFTQRDKNVPEFDNNKKAYLYYTRNSYELKFINYGTVVKTETKYYQADISGENFEPKYPETLEANAYVFDGWYTDQFFSEDGKFDFTGATMPAGPVVLYAHWVSVNHNVNIYSTNEMTADQKIGDTQVVKHGEHAVEPDQPKNPYSDQYKFVGWFYVSDTGEEKAFDFSMPVNRDLNLYAKWSSNTLVEYTIRYVLEDGTEIAPPTTGSALAGTTKTFNAKTGTELNEGYQSGYFPNVSSHSITFDIEDAAKNVWTFVYVEKPEVEYTVKYLEKGTGTQLADPKTVTTRDAVVTETFKQIKGYAPDAYQKQLVLAAEGNEIIFWYVKDDKHAPLQIIHWVQNIEGEGYTEYQSSTDLNAVIGGEYSETPLTIDGFRYNANPANPVDGYPALASGKMTESGLVLNLYYDRIEYPYEFRFVEQGSDPEHALAEKVTGTARYQAQVTQTAKTIPGYTLVSPENQAINIAIEDSAEVASKNVKIFYYTEQTVDIKYEVVGPTGCGTLDNYQESQLKVMTGTPQGSTPTANPGYRFVGWFMDETCGTRVENVIAGAVDSTTNKMTPQKRPIDDCHFAATYYALFEWDLVDLTITKTGCQAIDENQSFIFKVSCDGKQVAEVVIHGDGSAVITGLKVGKTYTVTEETAWSWRYKPTEATQTKTLEGGVANVVTFENSRTTDKWLSGDNYADNRFTN